MPMKMTVVSFCERILSPLDARRRCSGGRRSSFLGRLAENREIVQLYNKWFLKRLPTGERLDLPMSPQLEEFFRVLGVPD